MFLAGTQTGYNHASYMTFSLIENVCIVFDLDAWSRNPTNKFILKNCFSL